MHTIPRFFVLSLLFCSLAACSFNTAGLPRIEAEPSCDDVEINGDETDLDCGGPRCDPCENGRHCLSGADCRSTVCNADGVCEAAEPSCFDEATNGGETDLNCGGGQCPPCENDLRCVVDDDCGSGWCNGEDRCADPGCLDSDTNGDETDLNCGGPDCDPCDDLEACEEPEDCKNGVCTGNLCMTATCGDTAENGAETDFNCGGPDCAPCADGEACLGNSDCRSGVCTAFSCAPVTSCKNLLSLAPESVSGMYTITTGVATLDAYCRIEGGAAATFHYAAAALPTRKTTDADTCAALGLQLFTPRTPTHYAWGRDFALSIPVPTDGDFLGPMGIYNPNDGIDSIGSTNWCGSVYKNCCEKKMTGGGGDDTVSRSGCGFTSTAGGTFWASDISDMDEPNGDYDATCWLKFNYNTSGDVSSWNDRNCDYVYSNYLCMATDD